MTEKNERRPAKDAAQSLPETAAKTVATPRDGVGVRAREALSLAAGVYDAIGNFDPDALGLAEALEERLEEIVGVLERVPPQQLAALDAEVNRACERPYVCDDCALPFKWPGALDHHCAMSGHGLDDEEAA